MNEFKFMSFIEIMHFLDYLVKQEVLFKDPDDGNSILIYRSAPEDGNLYKEGWYSENIFNVASEILQDENNLLSLLKASVNHVDFLDAEQYIKRRTSYI